MSVYSRGSAREEARRIFKRIVSTLERIGKKYALLQFPTSYRERSIDLVTIGGSGSDAVIRIKVGHKVSRDEAGDLSRASLALDSVPVVVSDDPSLYDNIVYEKEGVFLMNERTLENMYLRPNEIIAFYRKGSIYFVADKEAIRESRAKRNMSLGDVAYLTNLTRKTIYMYEREGGIVSVETAEKLVDVLGSETVKSITLNVLKNEFLRKASKSVRSVDSGKVLEVLESSGDVYLIKKSAPDYIVRGEEIVTVIDASSKDRFYLPKTAKKVEECVKLSELVDGEVKVLVTPERKKFLEDELSTKIDLNKIILQKVKGGTHPE